MTATTQRSCHTSRTWPVSSVHPSIALTARHVSEYMYTTVLVMAGVTEKKQDSPTIFSSCLFWLSVKYLSTSSVKLIPCAAVDFSFCGHMSRSTIHCITLVPPGVYFSSSFLCGETTGAVLSRQNTVLRTTPPPNMAAANFVVIANGEGCALNGTAVAAVLIDQ